MEMQAGIQASRRRIDELIGGKSIIFMPVSIVLRSVPSNLRAVARVAGFQTWDDTAKVGTKGSDVRYLGRSDNRLVVFQTRKRRFSKPRKRISMKEIWSSLRRKVNILLLYMEKMIYQWTVFSDVQDGTTLADVPHGGEFINLLHIAYFRIG